jgi:3-hydroxyisobutyrate dehydrogenase
MPSSQPPNQNSTKIPLGFIGTGVMGLSMAGHLLRAGHPLYIFTRTREKARALETAGAIWTESPADLATSPAQFILTMVGVPKDVEEIYLGANGLLSAAFTAIANKLFIDMTTSSPKLAERIFGEARSRQVEALDAPVSGGDIGAREARLSIMVGGSKSAFDRAQPVLGLLGKNIVYQGPAGAGQHTKLCNQIAVAGTMLGVCEALAYSKKCGLDPETVLQSIGPGAAGSWTMANMAPRMLRGDFAPGFYVKHFIKDMRIALESAEEMRLDLPGLNLAKKLYEKLASEGGENLGTQSLFKLYTGES